MVQVLGDGVYKVMLKHDSDLVGKDTKVKDYDVLLTKALGDAKRHKVTLFVKERHISQESIDPTVDTELTYLLEKTGFTVLDEKNKPLADWAAAYLDDSSKRPPTSAAADIVIVGEAFSEFAARRGDLVSCKARVEVRARLDLQIGRSLSYRPQNRPLPWTWPNTWPPKRRSKRPRRNCLCRSSQR